MDSKLRHSSLEWGIRLLVSRSISTSLQGFRIMPASSRDPRFCLIKETTYRNPPFSSWAKVHGPLQEGDTNNQQFRKEKGTVKWEKLALPRHAPALAHGEVCHCLQEGRSPACGPRVGHTKATLMAPKMSQNWQSFPLPMPIQCIAEQGFPSLGCLTIPGAEGWCNECLCTEEHAQNY